MWVKYLLFIIRNNHLLFFYFLYSHNSIGISYISIQIGIHSIPHSNPIYSLFSSIYSKIFWIFLYIYRFISTLNSMSINLQH